eukprot:SAG22_NODE_3177_length_1874_cov_1.482817_2_plen_434_part_01
MPSKSKDLSDASEEGDSGGGQEPAPEPEAEPDAELGPEPEPDAQGIQGVARVDSKSQGPGPTVKEEARWIAKYCQQLEVNADQAEHYGGSSAATADADCITFLQCFQVPERYDADGGDDANGAAAATQLMGGAYASVTVAQALFKPLVAPAIAGEEKLTAQRLRLVRYVIAELRLPADTVWELFGIWVEHQVRTKALLFCCDFTIFLSKTVPFRAVLLEHQPLQQLLDGASGSSRSGNWTPGSLLRQWAIAAGPEGAEAAAFRCRTSTQPGHALLLSQLLIVADAEAWGWLAAQAMAGWTIHKLLGLVARWSAQISLASLADETSLTHIVAEVSRATAAPAGNTQPDRPSQAFLLRIDPGSPMARRAAVVALCEQFPEHTAPGLLALHAANSLASKFVGGFGAAEDMASPIVGSRGWRDHSLLSDACSVVEGLQ